MTDTKTFVLPETWVKALVDGDLSDIKDDDEEMAAFHGFMAHMLDEYGQLICLDVQTNPNGDITHIHDATRFGGKPCATSMFKFDVTDRFPGMRRQ